MTVDELLEELQYASDAGHGDMEVRAAIQPSWPLSASISNLGFGDRDGNGGSFFIAANEAVEYAPESAWEPDWDMAMADVEANAGI